MEFGAGIFTVYEFNDLMNMQKVWLGSPSYDRNLLEYYCVICISCFVFLSVTQGTRFRVYYKFFRILFYMFYYPFYDGIEIVFFLLVARRRPKQC